MSSTSPISSPPPSSRAPSRRQPATSSPLSEIPSLSFSSPVRRRDNSAERSTARRHNKRPRVSVSQRSRLASSRESSPGSPTLRSSRLSSEQKLNLMVLTLRQTKWTFEEFIDAWAGTHERSHGIIVYHQSYGRLEQRRRVMVNAIDRLAETGVWQSEEPPLVSVFERELDCLVCHEPFGEFTFGMTLDGLDSEKAATVIQEHAPRWYAFLFRICGTRRKRPEAYTQRQQEKVNRLVFSVTSMVCFTRTTKKSNTLATCMDLYLLGSGVHRRVFETLSGLGVCHGYKTGLNRMGSLTDYAKVRLSTSLKNLILSRTISHCLVLSHVIKGSLRALSSFNCIRRLYFTTSVLSCPVSCTTFTLVSTTLHHVISSLRIQHCLNYPVLSRTVSQLDFAAGA